MGRSNFCWATKYQTKIISNIDTRFQLSENTTTGYRMTVTEDKNNKIYQSTMSKAANPGDLSTLGFHSTNAL